MKLLRHLSRPIFMWALLLAAAFYAVAWWLGKLFDIESLRQISKIAFFVVLAVFVLGNPLQIVRGLAQALAWLYRAKLLSPFSEASNRMVIWTLFVTEAVLAFLYLLAMLLGNDLLQFGSMIGIVAGLSLVAAMLLPPIIRCLFRSVYWLCRATWRTLLLVRSFYRWLNFRRFIYLCLGFSALVLLFYAEEDVRGWWAWQNFKHKWEAKGERFDYASIIPAPAPDDQNFALTPIVASCYEWCLTKDGKKITPFRTNVNDRLFMPPWRWYRYIADGAPEPATTNGDWETGTFCDLNSWQNYYRTHVNSSHLVNDFPISPEKHTAAEDILFALSIYNPAMEELRKASTMPYSRFPLNYDADDPYGTMMAHVSALKRCVETLRLRSLAELELGRTNVALEDVRLSFRLIAATRTEPFLTSQYYRTKELEMVFQPIWEGVVKHKWSDAQLAVIEQELVKMDFLADSQLALRGERNESLTMVDYIRRHRPYHKTWRSILRVFTDASKEESEYQRKRDREEALTDIYRCLAPSGSFFQNKVIIGQTYQQWLLNTADPVKHEAFPQIQEAGSKFVGSLPHNYWNSLARNLLPGRVASTTLLCYAQETTDLARVGCALERYRLAQGAYPESLDALTPQFIDKIPHDIIGGKPLHYRRTADGKYLLYSVGWNEVDDGGKIGLREFSDHPDIWLGDWVWPCDSSSTRFIHDRP